MVDWYKYSIIRIWIQHVSPAELVTSTTVQPEWRDRSVDEKKKIKYECRSRMGTRRNNIMLSDIIRSIHRWISASPGHSVYIKIAVPPGVARANFYENHAENHLCDVLFRLKKKKKSRQTDEWFPRSLTSKILIFTHTPDMYTRVDYYINYRPDPYPVRPIPENLNCPRYRHRRSYPELDKKYLQHTRRSILLCQTIFRRHKSKLFHTKFHRCALNSDVRRLGTAIEHFPMHL